MDTPNDIKQKIDHLGFFIIEDIYSNDEINSLLDLISRADSSNPAFRKSSDIFAIRRFVQEIPDTIDIIFNDKLNEIINAVFGDEFFIVKSIYFDKPETSNWFVAYHQDLTISVDKRIDIDGFGPWTTKNNQFAVQPTLNILQDNFTIRIHLDDTTEHNGALKVIPGSHQNGVYRPETIDWKVETENVCIVRKGGVMIMKPLLLHSSGRTTNNNKRRVIHLEFSRSPLPQGLEWSELFRLKANVDNGSNP